MTYWVTFLIVETRWDKPIPEIIDLGGFHFLKVIFRGVCKETCFLLGVNECTLKTMHTLKILAPLSDYNVSYLQDLKKIKPLNEYF